MKFYLNQSVWDAALERIRWLFDEFPVVTVNYSGGKDSTVVLNLALQVAEEKGRLPLPVTFLDQEAEWATVIEHIREVMADPRVQPIWLQVPFRLFNQASGAQEWLTCWEPGKEWMRPKEPDSVHDNVFGVDRFAEMFGGARAHYWPKERVATLAGVRAEESPARLKGLTSYETYKGETWGKVEDKKRGHFTFYPLYDWSFTDVWKAIQNNGWPYCRLYDLMFQHGVPLANMRVSNLTAEGAVTQLFFAQEVERETWNALTRRLQGINSVGHLREDVLIPRELPYMFASWKEYRDHLVDNLVVDPEHRAQFHKIHKQWDARYHEEAQEKLTKAQINAVLRNDYHGTGLSVFAASNGQHSKGRGKRGGSAAGTERANVGE